jgi:hypothetical protein
MHFSIKNYLKNNHYHITKQPNIKLMPGNMAHLKNKEKREEKKLVKITGLLLHNIHNDFTLQDTILF